MLPSNFPSGISSKWPIGPIVVLAFLATICFNHVVLNFFSSESPTGNGIVGDFIRYSYVITHWAVFVVLSVLLVRHFRRERYLELPSMATFGVVTWLWCALLNLPIPVYSELGYSTVQILGGGSRKAARTGLLKAVPDIWEDLK